MELSAQMIAIRAAKGTAQQSDLKAELFSDEYPVNRPLLQAIEPHDNGPPVLPIDQQDRADRCRNLKSDTRSA